jgi:hypothetical protein
VVVVLVDTQAQAVTHLQVAVALLKQAGQALQHVAVEEAAVEFIQQIVSHQENHKVLAVVV